MTTAERRSVDHGPLPDDRSQFDDLFGRATASELLFGAMSARDHASSLH